MNAQREKAKSKLSRRKASVTKHINVVENLLKSHGSRRKLCELAEKIFKDYIIISNKQVIEGVNRCIENIAISINERVNKPPSDAGSDYTSSLPFESTSGQSKLLGMSESERRARVMDLQVEKAKREAQLQLEGERKRAENLELERQLQEHR